MFISRLETCGSDGPEFYGHHENQEQCLLRECCRDGGLGALSAGVGIQSVLSHETNNRISLMILHGCGLTHTHQMPIGNSIVISELQ